MTYTIETDLFDMFPNFRRGVLVAIGIDNTGSDPETARLLSEAASEPANPLSRRQERIDVWNAAYTKFGTDPNKYTPSIRFLSEQIARGRAPRSINKLVDVFNVISLRWAAPCGGDDLDSLNGDDLCLGFAHGDETFAPLFKPLAIDNPAIGEPIYFTPQTRRVLCRRWTWRNSDFSKIRYETKAVAINIDMMIPPFSEGDLKSALRELATLVQQFCGGSVRSHVLSPTNPQLRIEL